MSERKEVKIEDILLIPSRNGLTKPSAIRGKGAKMIAMGELFAHPIICDIDMDRVPVNEKELKSSSIEINDLLFARQSLTLEGAGKCSIVKEVNEPTVFESHLIRLRIDSNLANPWYVYYYFNSYYGKHSIQNIVNQVAAAGIKGSDLVKLEIPLPSLDIQNKIAAQLSEIDDKIAVNKKICENLEAQAQALFKHWFVDFAPFKDGKFVESELGLIPEGWRVGKAEDFYTINIGKTPPRAERQWFSESKGNNKTWISISDMGSCGTFISDSKEYLTPEAQSKFNVVMVPVGTILLSFKLTIGRVAIADNELTTNEAIARFILPNSDYREFTYLYLKQYKYESLGSTSSIATAVNSKIIKSMPLLMPPTEVMTKFSAVVGNLFDEIRILSSESLRLSTLRDTLLPKLMSGEISLE